MRAGIRNPAQAEGIMNPEIRVGTGYDVHRLVPGRKLILGGAEIPYSLGLDLSLIHI